MKRDGNKKVYMIMLIGFTGILAALMVFGILLNKNLKEGREDVSEEKKYSFHIAMISQDSSDAFWNQVYQGAYEEGLQQGIYVEKFGAALKEEYDTEELMRMAIAARVDGIIVEADGSEEMKALINNAAQRGIPVVTVLGDEPDSMRKSFVSINTYSLGEMYGEEALRAAKEISDRITVLIEHDQRESVSKAIYSGIHETLTRYGADDELSTVKTGGNGEFESEETVRNLLLDKETRPDVLICLSAIDTISAYQCVIDYNLVGKVQIIGCYKSPEILEGIQKGIIQSTFAADAGDMGKKSVQQMKAHLEHAYTSEYVPVEARRINRENVEAYVKEDGE